MEERNIPAAGEFYRHFKGNLYQIVGVAKHSETMEQMVVYQALYGDYGLYTRPLELFLSPVDKMKYPAATQEYRFEKCVPGVPCNKDVSVTQSAGKISVEAVSDLTSVEVCHADSVGGMHAKKTVSFSQNNSEMKSGDEESVRPEILRFLDAEGDEAKLEVLRKLRNNLDEGLLTIIELSLDLLPDDKESLERRYDFVERTLQQRIRFEGGRLR